MSDSDVLKNVLFLGFNSRPKSLNANFSFGISEIKKCFKFYCLLVVTSCSVVEFCRNFKSACCFYHQKECMDDRDLRRENLKSH